MFDDLPNCLEFSVPQMYTDHTHFTFAGREPDLIERNLNYDWLVSGQQTDTKQIQNWIRGDWDSAKVKDSWPISCSCDW